MANKQEQAAAATEAKKFIMSDEDIQKAFRLLADQLTPDATADLLLEIMAQDDKEDMEKVAPIDRIMWTTRSAFLCGTAKGFTLYRDAIKMELGEPVC